MPEDLIIDVSHLRKSFHEQVVVKDLDLAVKRGEVFGFLGPNGSGKTTSIRMLCGLLTPDSGSGTCLGFDILKESRNIKQRVGYMTQHYSFYGDLTVTENLNFFARVYGLDRCAERVQNIMEEHDLLQYGSHLTGQLSGGWKQRVALAACLLHEPDMLLLDEPTAGIDPIARRDFWDRIHALSEKGITTLMSTHYMDEAERCTRLAYLAYGELLITGTVDEVIAATHLKTWNISGEVTTGLLQKVKALSGVTQAALFGREIHVSGFDTPLIEQGLRRIQADFAIQCTEITPTLEDAFISLVQDTTITGKVSDASVS
ncbi:MAG: ABC transporter ATP-binding protein [Legionellaceae bacterium]|nr:ABC transporter ATP-binding protein [Legionellaceae bacterium]MBP9776184.1 ABC transporter ATP-binding protein [Legionellaceae bacterium]